MTALDLAAIRERAEKATDGPWDYHESSRAWRCWSVWGVRPDENVGDGEVHIGDIRGIRAALASSATERSESDG